MGETNIEKTSSEQIKQPLNFSDVLSGWLRVFARMWPQRELTADDFTIYADLLSELDAAQLDAACRKAAKECRFFPTPADILANCKKAEKIAESIAGEQAWQKVLQYIERYFLGGDVGLKPGAPQLPADIDHAQRAAGGLQWIEGCPAEDLQWAKKRFIEAYEAFHQSPSLKSFASSEDARRILQQAAGEIAEQKKTAALARCTSPSTSLPER